VPASSELDETLRFTASIVSRRARKIVERLEAWGFSTRSSRIRTRFPTATGSGVVIELPHRPWYVDAKTLRPAGDAARAAGRHHLRAEKLEKTYFEWMENIQPWCISRQLWWGTRFRLVRAGRQVSSPKRRRGTRRRARLLHVTGTISEAEGEKIACRCVAPEPVPGARRGRAGYLGSPRAVAVLYLGWPDDTPELKRYFRPMCWSPAFDIIFFWVAR